MRSGNNALGRHGFAGTPANAPAVADGIFRSAMQYDALNRLVVAAHQGADGTLDANFASAPVDSETLFTRFGYDSRSNRTLTIDPKGNSTVTVYDGASRATQVQQHLRERGQGDAPPAADSTFLAFGGACITTTTRYDGNSRVRQLVDDNGNQTLWTYDTLNRQALITFHDGSTRVSVFDTASDVVEYTDENGSVFTNTFDPLGRRVDMAIDRAAGVIGTTGQSFQYDGRSRMTFARDSVGSDHADVTLVYDSLGRVLEDSQTFGGQTRNVTNEGFTSHPMTQFAFPSGRQLTNVYDAMYRRTEVGNTGGSSIAAWQFFGPGRLAECALGNGLMMTCMNNARTRSALQAGQSTPSWGDQSSDRLGYDGAGRMITKRFLAGGVDGGTHAYNNTSSVVGQTTVFDKASNKLYERELHAESRSHLYEPFDDQMPQGGLDSLDRLRQYQRGVLSSTGGYQNAGGGSIVTSISLPGTDQSRTYQLDGLGNWHHTVYTPVGGSQVDELRQHNGLNQITSIDGGGGNVPFSYDGVPGASNGNLTNDGIRAYEWDALNRLKQVYKDPNGTPEIIGTYDYDALGRRIRKVVSNGGLSGTISNGTADFIYNSNWQCVEERNGSNHPTKQYVWGVYIDELLQQRNAPAGTPADFYPLQDLLYRTTALTDAAGDIVETYDCDAYGNTLIFDAPGAGANWWADGAHESDAAVCDYVFVGRYCDSESALYHFRYRNYSPTTGRFLARDPISSRAIDNSYLYAASAPTVWLDPLGLDEFGILKPGCQEFYYGPETLKPLQFATRIPLYAGTFALATTTLDNMRSHISICPACCDDGSAGHEAFVDFSATASASLGAKHQWGETIAGYGISASVELRGGFENAFINLKGRVRYCPPTNVRVSFKACAEDVEVGLTATGQASAEIRHVAGASLRITGELKVRLRACVVIAYPPAEIVGTEYSMGQPKGGVLAEASVQVGGVDVYGDKWCLWGDCSGLN